MEANDKKIIISAYEYSYKIEEALKHNRKRCVSFVQFTNTTCCWFGVIGSHDMEDIEKKMQLFCINIFRLSNLMTVPKSVSSESARGAGRWAKCPPAANSGRTSVKLQLDPSEYLSNIQPETNYTPVVCGFQSLNLNGDL